MTNPHEQIREVFVDTGSVMNELPVGSDERSKAIDDYVKMYRLIVEQARIEEETLDRRNQMEFDEARRKKVSKDTIVTCATIAGITAFGFIVEARGFIMPKITNAWRVIKF